MNVDAFLARLKDVKKTGHNKWVARCPSHESKSGASLAIAVGDKGGLVLYDFGGCTFNEIVDAAGADVSDLLPERQPDNEHQRRRPRASPLTPLIAAFEKDLILVHLFLSDVGNGKTISAVDRMTAKGAAARIWTALREARHAA